MRQVLIVGDDHATTVALRSELTQYGYDVLWARSVSSGVRLVRHVDVAILSLTRGSSDDGVVDQLRAAGDNRVPIVVIALPRDDDPPYEPSERTGRAAFGVLTVDFEAYRAERDGLAIDLSPREFDLLRYLVEHADRVVSRDELLEAVWRNSSETLTRTVDVHIAKLRRKIGDSSTRPTYIITIPRSGYRFIARRDAATSTLQP